MERRRSYIQKSDSLVELYISERCFITELVNLPDNPLMSVSKARVTSGVTTALHRLLETEERYFILSGKGEMEIDGEVVGLVAKGDTVFIPANATQRITNVGSDDLIFLCICTPRFVFENYEDLEIE